MRKEVGLVGEDDDIRPILVKIQEKQGIDFTQYRDGTLRRRIGRRVAARGCADLASYLSLLDSNPEEYDYLLRDLTIKYTEFFRDPWVFDIIRETALPAIVARKQSGGDAQARVLETCSGLLAPNGYLILGTGEIVPKDVEPRLVTVDRKAKIYRRSSQPSLGGHG